MTAFLTSFTNIAKVIEELFVVDDELSTSLLMSNETFLVKEKVARNIVSVIGQLLFVISRSNERSQVMNSYIACFV